MADEIHMLIESDRDIVVARQRGRTLAISAGLSSVESTLIATAISELAQNIVLYAKRGEIILQLVERSELRGIVVIARDDGPGILDPNQALQSGDSTSASLGLGLEGVRRLMDQFEIVSQVGQGTTVTVTKWGKRPVANYGVRQSPARLRNSSPIANMALEKNHR